jgi:iron-sulfur cluster repair protein YtfE (RIC family)
MSDPVCVLLDAGLMTGLRQQMCEDHERLSRALGRLRRATASSDEPTVQRLWGHFEAGLMAHFEAEEKYLLPLVEPVHPDEVVALREEHASLRELLAVAAATEAAPALSSAALAELASRLDKHARREDQLLYGVAEAASDESLRQSLTGYLAATYALLKDVVAED